MAKSRQHLLHDHKDNPQTVCNKKIISDLLSKFGSWYTHTCSHTHTHLHAHLHTHTYTHTHTHTYTHIYTHTPTHTHTHAHTKDTRIHKHTYDISPPFQCVDTSNSSSEAPE